jgi:hypothetical protein
MYTTGGKCSEYVVTSNERADIDIDIDIDILATRYEI